MFNTYKENNLMTYEFLQQYWWFIVSLLGALLVFLLFVQGANSMVHSIGRTEDGQRKVIESTGRKWEITFTTLVTFGGAFFASFPLFYSTSFGGAYWLWMIILFSFVLQAVSYEFQLKKGNLLLSLVPRAERHSGSAVARRSRGYVLRRVELPCREGFAYGDRVARDKPLG